MQFFGNNNFINSIKCLFFNFFFRLQHRSLLPTLRPYQRNAVRWMISREMGDIDIDSDSRTDENALHPLYEEVRTMEGTKLYLNRVGGFLVKEKPLYGMCPPGGTKI